MLPLVQLRGLFPMCPIKIECLPLSTNGFMMNLLVWNCRGAGGRNFPGHIRDLVSIYKLSFVAILEPRIIGNRANNVINRIGFDGVVKVEARGFAGGIWCMWRQNQMTIQVLYTSNHCILLKVNPRSDNAWLLAVIYASPQERGREALWSELREINNSYSLPWCAIGDFNAVLMILRRLVKEMWLEVPAKFSATV